VERSAPMRLAERSARGPLYEPTGATRGGGGVCEDRRSWHGSGRVGSQTLSEAQRWQACLELDGWSIAFSTPPETIPRPLFERF
jgi:hypothetical protein